MNVHDMFPSKYVACGDLRGMDVPVRIARIDMEDVSNGDLKPIVYFVGMKKGLVLNRTNAKRIATMHGPETNGWLGKDITLYPSETEFKGETVPCIRVRGDNAGWTYVPGETEPESEKSLPPVAAQPVAAVGPVTF
jgi:hypothetical protein